MPYVIIVNRLIIQSSLAKPEPQYELSYPVDDLKEAKSLAREKAIWEHRSEDIQGKYKIIPLYIPSAEYCSWRKGKGTYILQETLDEFFSLNQQYLIIQIQKDEACVRERAVCIAQGMRSPASFFSRLTPDLAARIAAFSAEKFKVLSGDALEQVAHSYIEKSKSGPMPIRDSKPTSSV